MYKSKYHIVIMCSDKQTIDSKDVICFNLIQEYIQKIKFMQKLLIFLYEEYYLKRKFYPKKLFNNFAFRFKPKNLFILNAMISNYFFQKNC